MTETAKTYKRGNYFIGKKFQTDFILKFCSLVFLGGLLTIGGVYLLAMRSTTVSVVHSRVLVRSTADFILPVLVQTVVAVGVIVGIATIAVTLFISHKIAGPLFRFKKVLKAVEGGDYCSAFQIRKLDQLQDLTSAFNNMISKNREQLNLLKLNFVSLKDKMDKLSEGEFPEHKRGNLSEIKRISEELDRIIRYFKS
jgi:methyl-accepting chemotaxis protein